MYLQDDLLVTYGINRPYLHASYFEMHYYYYFCRKEGIILVNLERECLYKVMFSFCHVLHENDPETSTH